MQGKKQITNFQKCLRVFLVFIVLVLGIAVESPSNVQALGEDAPALFVDVAVVESQSDTRPQVVRARSVALNLGNLADGGQAQGSDAKPEITLNLFADVTYTGIIDQVVQNRSGSQSWIGRLQENPSGYFYMVLSEGVFSAHVASPDGIYEVQPAGDDLYQILEIDQSKLPEDRNDTLIPELGLEGIAQQDVVASDSSSQIDVMVLYTTAAKNYRGGTAAISSLIDLAVTQTNQSYVNSGITTSLNLVHKAEVSYAEDTNMAVDLNRLTSASDGIMDNVHTLRNTYKADLVSLIVAPVDLDTCGIAWLMTNVSTSFDDYAFNVVAVDCATAGYSFAHELGHNQGARHNWEIDTETTPYAYAHGYLDTAHDFTTIMSYNSSACPGGSCTRLQYWSNPNKTDGSGHPLGVPEGQPRPAENWKTLNNTASTVANFRVRSGSTPPGDFNKFSLTDNASAQSTSLTFSWGSSSGASSYQFCYDDYPNNACSSTWTSTGTATSKTINDLDPETTYEWHVRAVNSYGTTYANGSASAFWSFTTPTGTTFADVPADHWAYPYIEALYANELTAGCADEPLRFCPDTILDRAQSAVFMLRGNFGPTYEPPAGPWDLFADNWSQGTWAEKWAEGMYDKGLTAGCSADPLRFCPWDQLPRTQVAVFGLKLKYGNEYTPPDATGTVFADVPDANIWYAKWAEQAYYDGLLPTCGTQGGKPLFCPNQLVDRATGAYVVVKAKDLPLP